MNKNDVIALLSRNDYAVTKAVIVLFGHQTHLERGTRSTVESNRVGFNVVDADLGSYCAHWVLGTHRTTPAHIVAERVAHYLTGDNYRRYRCLSGSFLARAREMMPKYWAQLDRAAQAKQAQAVPF